MLFLLACTPTPEDSAKPDADADTDTDTDSDSDADADSDAEAMLAGFDDATLVGQESEWSSASTPVLIATAVLPAGAGGASDDPACPVVTTSGASTTITGGCTDTNGVAWLGTMVMDDTSVSYSGFGFDQPDEDCGGSRSVLVYTGTLTAEGGAAQTAFVIDLVGEISGADDDCVDQDITMAMAYAGSQEVSGADADGDGEPDVQTYSGSGTYGFSHIGKAGVTTVDEVIDDATCEHEAASGQTEVTASGNTLTYTYDGATDCDEAATVRWAFNGADQGELEGVSCAAGRAPAWLFGVALLFLRRR